MLQTYFETLTDERQAWKVKHNLLELEKINDILSYAGIKNAIVFLGEQFGIAN
ncbi:MAG: hypothetical protein Q4D37_09670 [Oscillospiraceae bacterium]|nr:hypothetical protein [Oscillospiraceae bacterium]